MKRLVYIFLCVLIITPAIAYAADDEIDYPHFMYRMEVGDFGDDFKTVGKTYQSPPIIVPFGVSDAEDNYILYKSETNEYVEISVDGYAGGNEYSYETLINAVEAYFGADTAQFVRDNFDYTMFNITGDKFSEEIDGYSFRYIAGNNHRGYSVTVKREPIFFDLVLTDEDWQTMRPVEVDAVVELFGEGIIQGVGNGMFDPDSNVTRAQFAVMFARLIGADGGDYKGLFSDVPDKKWYTGAVEAIAEMGYIIGYNNMFLPDDLISFQDMFLVAYRYLNENNILTENKHTTLVITNFMEKNDMEFDDYAKIAINELYARGMIRYIYLESARESAARIQIAEFINGIRKYINLIKINNIINK